MKYISPKLDENGWSEWIQPKMSSYRMKCCDCALVHEMVFKVIPCGKGHKVIFKARRHVPATAATRRHKK